jgi:hypothetical protein
MSFGVMLILVCIGFALFGSGDQQKAAQSNLAVALGFFLAVVFGLILAVAAAG